jgi:hypothetical protein
MSTESTLTHIARHLKENLEARELALKRELQELEARQAAIRAQLGLAAVANDRLANYDPGSIGDSKCPFCWMQSEQRSVLYPIGGGTRHEDHYRCDECKAEITVAID